jgi:hypothetical protein
VTRQSTTGNLFLYNGTLISWRSKLKKTIALSTAETECYSASRAAVEVVYIRSLLSAMEFAPAGYTPVNEDDTACSGATISSAGENVPSTSTSASTLRTRPSSSDASFCFGSLRRNSSRISSPRASTPPRGQPASRRFSAGSGYLRKGRRYSRGEWSRSLRKASKASSNSPSCVYGLRYVCLV